MSIRLLFHLIVFVTGKSRFFRIAGSTKARTRLYRMGITKYITEVEKDFEVLGMRDNGWHPFKKGEDYEAFLVKRKKMLIFAP